MMKEIAENAANAAKKLRQLDAEKRKEVLLDLAESIVYSADDIIKANDKDLIEADNKSLNNAMKDRLKLDKKRIHQMAQGVRQIAAQDEVVGTFSGEFVAQNGMTVKHQSIPLGVILMIFESRPNVVIDCAALAIKSSNAMILKGGKEAKYSNEILGEIVQNCIEKWIPRDSIQVLASDDRSVINELLSLEQFIDVVIPRGGEQLIKYVYENAKMPVIAHFKGLCHMFLDESANKEMALKLVLNAKTQRPGVCNALETLLIHKNLMPYIANCLTKELLAKETEVRADSDFYSALENDLQNKVKSADEKDWNTEYLDNILSIKTVENISDAIQHIDRYGSKHSEAIITENEENVVLFLNSVDASCVLHNASTRFNDGGELGLGAELGISTTKFHAYGPMGAQQMTTSRFVVIGSGQIRD